MQKLILMAVLFAVSLASAQAALPTSCAELLDCNSCLNTPSLPNCGWCGETGRCQLAGVPCQVDMYVNPTSTAFTSGPDYSEAFADVKPYRQRVFLRAGTPLPVVITVTPQPCKPVDLYVLMDFSGSMSDDLSSIKNLGVPLTNKLRELCSNPVEGCPPSATCARAGFGTFIEKPAFSLGYWTNSNDRITKDYSYAGATLALNYAFRPQLALTNNLESFTARLQAISGINDNRDFPENLAEGLMQALRCRKLVKWEPFNEEDEPRRIIVTLTDDSLHLRNEGLQVQIVSPSEAKCYINETYQELVEDTAAFSDSIQRIVDEASMVQDFPSMVQLREALLDYNTVPVFGVTSNHIKFYRDMVKSLGFGQAAVITSDSSNIVSVIDTAYKSIAAQLNALVQSNGNEWLIQSISPSAGYTNAVIGTAYPFTFTLLYDGARPAANDLELLITFVGFRTAKIIVDLVNVCECKPEYCWEDKCGVHGTCDCGRCTCNPGWSGIYCDCSSDTSTCPSPNGQVCSGLLRGRCECGACVCQDGFTGPACDCPTTGCPFRYGLLCAGHGTCECGACSCDSEWDASADCSCPTDTASSSCVVGDSEPCFGQGLCDAQCNTCDCFPGYFGDQCQNSIVPCPFDCYGHGTCCDPLETPDCNPGTCDCDSGFEGDYCDCSTTCPGSCSGHGTCSCGECICDIGYSLANCSCQDQCTIVNGQFCAGHGSCACDGSCICEPGYAPPYCECQTNAVCPTSNPLTVCSGHGSCNCGTCDCVGAYTGADCSCNNVGCLSDCGASAGNGQCQCGQCVCEGTFLPETLCQCDGAIACPTWEHSPEGETCSGHGECVNQLNSRLEPICATCVCDRSANGLVLWTGSDCSCSTAPCPGLTIGGKKCNEAAGHGVCNCGVCTCLNGYSGDSCECAPCANDCGPHGVCNCGTCVCDAFWVGANCDYCDVLWPGNNCEVDGCMNRTSCLTCAGFEGCTWCDTTSLCWNVTNAAVQCVAADKRFTNDEQCRVNRNVDSGQAVGVFAGAFGGLFFLLLLIGLAYKAFTVAQDRREWRKFELEKEKMRWKGDANPLFMASTKEFSNPLYTSSMSEKL